MTSPCSRGGLYWTASAGAACIQTLPPSQPRSLRRTCPSVSELTPSCGLIPALTETWRRTWRRVSILRLNFEIFLFLVSEERAAPSIRTASIDCFHLLPSVLLALVFTFFLFASCSLSLSLESCCRWRLWLGPPSQSPSLLSVGDSHHGPRWGQNMKYKTNRWLALY